VTEGARPGHEGPMPRPAAAESHLTPPAEPPAAPAAFYEAYFDFVWRSLRRLGVPEAALDDAAQDVFIVAFRRRDEFAGRSSIKTWLFGIAWNRARELARRRRRKPEEPLPECLVDTGPLGPERALLAREAFELLYAALDELSPERRALFVMAELEDMSAAEIVEVTAAPLNTVYSRLRLARRDFEAAIQRLKAKRARPR
jgi:RNA polymerase sigma-70 factor (ECF subfamily)